ncbi:hypothetical protein TK11N_06850 [Tetragenococcus koreensis]|uniref:Uncharacterized protein n=1 Tax=Tetragenococcus koreensis TaxID=290335 RepID=A0AAN4RKA5_9ENTE|nr:hypothetical protein TK11N_06850 [Tetragenococcus koreensis]GEQ51176.1 hypothetical protein TK12N_05200 [Tetragenococcus koreensis]GEQ53825.1 hypothetical protein TK2N_06690 [Tetragenococcus koreensis]GEQ56177.1 hypothetical protein TK4N_05200 [Tetragenococcus koreensis]GEQ58846.1 hypothetical protein TK6N_06850 [Tetragenococcus koreensis]
MCFIPYLYNKTLIPFFKWNIVFYTEKTDTISGIFGKQMLNLSGKPLVKELKLLWKVKNGKKYIQNNIPTFN